MAIDVMNRFPFVKQNPRLIENRPSVRDGSKEADSPLSFESVLKAKTVSGQELKVSKHANARIAERNIDLTPSQWERLQSGVKKAEMKGINESLIMVDDVAFIVNVNKNTVITAVDENEDKVFTNIDGAVIV